MARFRALQNRAGPGLPPSRTIRDLIAFEAAFEETESVIA